MTLDQLSTQVYPGTGLVTRSPGGVLVVAPSVPAQDPITMRLLRVVAEAQVTSGQQLLYQVVAAIGSADAPLVPAFCVIGSAGSDLVLLAKGAANILIRRLDGDEERWSAEGEPTWVEHTIELPIDSVEVLVGGSSSAARDRRLDLRTGVVAGGGVLVTPSGPRREPGHEPVIDLVAAEAARPNRAEPDLALPEEPAFTSVLLTGDPAAEARAPLPLATEEPGARGSTEAVMVTGVLCSRDHFNNPIARFCSACGISMIQQTQSPVPGLRPPLGYLVLDDGATFSLDRDYVVGRDPSDDAEVLSGRARPLHLPDPTRNISRFTHAVLQLDGWNVKIADRRSTNGTYVVQPGENVWNRVEPETPVTLQSGAQVLIGQRVLVFDAHHG